MTETLAKVYDDMCLLLMNRDFLVSGAPYEINIDSSTMSETVKQLVKPHRFKQYTINLISLLSRYLFISHTKVHQIPGSHLYCFLAALVLLRERCLSVRGVHCAKTVQVNPVVCIKVE